MEDSEQQAPPQDETRLVERIERAKLQPLNDPSCQHQWRILDEDSGVPNHYAVACKKCPIGQLVHRDSLAALGLPLPAGLA